MPTSQTQRTIVLKSSFSGATVADLHLDLDANFSLTAGAAVNKFDDNSAGTSEERTKYSSTFKTASGADIGVITLRLIGKDEVTQTGVTVAKTTARSNIVPAPTVTSVALLEDPTHSFERIWKRAARQGKEEIVDNIGKLDMRVKASAGYTVTQSVDAQKDDSLTIGYAWLDANGLAVVSGTVVLLSSATAGAGYTLGGIRVTDNDPTTNSERVRNRDR